MPPEWAPHAATWMIFPPSVYDDGPSLDDARGAWSQVARTVAKFEPVTMLVRPRDRAEAQARLGDSVILLECEVDDAWARDSGATFVTNGHGGVEAVDWRFNGWG